MISLRQPIWVVWQRMIKRDIHISVARNNRCNNFMSGAAYSYIWCCQIYLFLLIFMKWQNHTKEGVDNTV